ncbi:MAG: toll/interleukin-1 receptor domain-containing protein, partial [bacterium]
IPTFIRTLPDWLFSASSAGDLFSLCALCPLYIISLAYVSAIRFNIFISYSSKDIEDIMPVNILLKSIQDTDVFIADESLAPGTEISNELINKISKTDIFIVFFSTNSAKSNYVQQEIGVARANNKLIIPIVLDGTKPTGMLTGINYLDLSNQQKYQAEIGRLYNFINSNIQQKKQNQLILVLGLLGLGYLMLNNSNSKKLMEQR